MTWSVQGDSRSLGAGDPSQELWSFPAVTLAAELRARRLGAVEVVQSCLDRIAACDDTLLSFITVAGEQALAEAAALDARSQPVGPLHGVPVAVKDLTDVAGLPTTRGSPLSGGATAVADAPLIARLRAAGAIVIGKTNTPDFGFASICTSTVRGATRTPHDPRLSSEGSSGGSAAAVAAGLVPLATGGDFGGSLRTPASFCGISSIRPTPGTIPDPHRPLAWLNLMTDGPMGRSVDDCTLMFDAMAGIDDADPLSCDARVAKPPSQSTLRVAVSEDLGVAPVSAEVRALFRAALDRVDDACGPLIEAVPDCADAIQTFLTLRAGVLHHVGKELLAQHGAALPASVRWNIEQGWSLSAEHFLEAEAARGRLYRRFARLFEAADVLLLPATAVMPFPAETIDITAIDGQPLATIVDYYAITFIISLIACPVVTVPCGWSDAGLPLGMQIVGRPRSDRFVIDVARRFERELGFAHRWPALPADGTPFSAGLRSFT